MRKLVAHFSVFALLFAASASFAQVRAASRPASTRLPVQVDSGFFQALGAAPKFERSNNMSPDAKAGASQNRLRSIPNFTSAFTFQGQVFPFTMAGHSPQRGETTEIDTSFVAISWFFDEFTDQNGNNIVIDTTPIVKNTLTSPNFERFPYTSGFTQFGDAVQRAEFFHVVDRDGDRDWHTLLEQPRQLTPVQVEVPVGSAMVFQDPSGNIGALIDINFLVSQLNTIFQLEGFRVTELPILITRDAVFGDFVKGRPVDCCIGGFHSAFETKQVGNIHFVQTFAFATSLDSDLSDFIFGDPTIFADVEPMSHEISEWMNDPFVNNAVPAWQFPDLPPGTCQANLETGDPVENLPDPTFPVTLHGFTYHPQTEALLQWFSREVPSSAIDGAYSYPNESTLPTPSMACPQ